jgi:hypothetical protein
MPPRDRRTEASKATAVLGPVRRGEDSVRSASHSTRAEFELADPIAMAADTEFQHRLMLVLGELEVARPRFAAPADRRALAGLVPFAAGWVARLSEVLAAVGGPTAADPAVSAALAAAGQFLTEARDLGERPGGWRTGFGLFAGAPTGSTADRVRLLATAPEVIERLLAATAVGFQLPEFAAGWSSTAAAFSGELRRELAWAVTVSNGNRVLG